jgi:hypothetical protein
VTRLPMRTFAVLALAVAVGVGTAASPFASSSPDGLERVAAEQGFADAGRLHDLQDDAPVAHYAFPGVGNERLATGLAGFAGTLAVFGLGYGAARLLRRRPANAPVRPPTAAR